MSDSNLQKRSLHFFTKHPFWVPSIILLLIVAILLYKPIHYHFTHVVTNDAYVSGDLVIIAPSISGRLSSILVEEGDTVAQGQVIAYLSDEAHQAIQSQAEASVGSAKSRLAEAEIQLELERQRAGPLADQDEADLIAARARLTAIKAALGQTKSEFKRILRLSQSNLVSESELDAALTRQQTRQAQLEGAQEEVHKAEATCKLSKGHLDAVRIQAQRVETARADFRLAEAEQEAADIHLGNTHLQSPVQGIVAHLAANNGELLEDGQTIALIRSLETLWITANIEETEIRRVQIGQAVNISVDAYPSRIFSGKVIGIGSVTSSLFSLIPRQKISGNFVKVVQRVPVRISVSDLDGLLKLGLSIKIGIDIQSSEHYLE